MAAYLSQDLRIRVIRAIEGGMSRTAVRWMQTYLSTGRTH